MAVIVTVSPSVLQGYDVRDLCDDDDRIQFVHQNVPNGTSEALGMFRMF